ncbi:MAG: protein YgfX [Gammaproteobacteria bacterium]
MSSPTYGEPLELDIRPSRLIATLVFAIHVTAAVICSQLPVSLLSRLVILLAILGSLMWNVVIFWRRTPRRLQWSPEEGWRITEHNGVVQSVEILPQAHLGNWIVIAHFRTSDRKRRAVMLARDSCSADSLRRLRVMLRYGTPKR